MGVRHCSTGVLSQNDPQPDDPDAWSGFWNDVGVFESQYGNLMMSKRQYSFWAVWSYGIPHFLVGKWITTPIHIIGRYLIYQCVFFTLTKIRTHESGMPSRGNSGTGRRGSWGTCELIYSTSIVRISAMYVLLILLCTLLAKLPQNAKVPSTGIQFIDMFWGNFPAIPSLWRSTWLMALLPLLPIAVGHFKGQTRIVSF